MFWRLLDQNELMRLWKYEMQRDFPKAELKPALLLARQLRAGVYRPWAVFESEAAANKSAAVRRGPLPGLAAYLLVLQPAGAAAALLDYFAVVPACRAAGLGTSLLKTLCETEGARGEGAAKSILLEIEIPSLAPDAAMAARRRGFYLRAGAVPTGWRDQAFGVWFELLTLSAAAAPMPADEAARELAACYRAMLGERRCKKYFAMQR